MFSSYTSFQGGGLHTEFYYEQGNWQRNNPILFSWWMHHYSSRHSSCFWIKVQSHLSWRYIEKGFNFSSEGNFMEVFKDAQWSFSPSLSVMFTYCEIQRSHLVDFSYPRLQDWRLWNNRRLWWFRARMLSFTPKADWDYVAPENNKKIQIINPVLEKILISLVWIKRIIGWSNLGRAWTYLI